jgi:bifunctional polynucleotide phosphatase/kinase
MQSKRLSDFKQKASVVLSRLDLPIGLYAATGKDHFRKPRTGMWEELLRDLGLESADVDLENSIFVGDAGGRQGTGKPGSAKDHACSDR